MFNLTCKVNPNDEAALIKNLETLGPRCKPVLKKAIRPLANQAKKAIKPLVPKRTGNLRKSITLVPIRSKKFYTTGFRIYFRYVAASTENGKPKTKFLKSKGAGKKGDKVGFYAFAPEYGVRKG